MQISINPDRLTSELAELAAFSALEAPEVSRIVFSEHDLRARAWLKDLCAQAGLDVREDAVGNTFARWHGSDREAPAVGTGSHIDAIPHSGRYDGTVGVLAGLEAIRALQAASFVPRRSLELLLFTSEEPTLFGLGCLGSRLLTGSLEVSVDTTMKDAAGRTLREIRTAAGFTGDLASVRLPDNYYDSFVELHIEQGPLLERRGVPVGVVTAIAAPASLRLEIYGQGGHAGAVLMRDRHDAFLAAAEIALALEKAALATGSIDSVATTGVCDLFPRVSNGIASRVHLEADIRDIDGVRRDGMIEHLERTCEDVATRRGVSISIEIINRDAPCACAPKIVDAISAVCTESNLPFDRMVSRAYHDSLFMARICPTAMLFIPCRNGVSHRPDEYASPEAIAQGTLVLAQTLARLSES